MSEMITNNGEQRLHDTPDEHPNEKKVNKYCYILLAVFLGDFGIHQFYAGRVRRGILYLIFCWTFIPELLSIFDIIKACGKIKDTEDQIWM
ncbi:MAG TPA: TM2 domain-containing protein [Lachnospiraceae bacterium]|nr:TM2 domain-containing protein [Lachnospiraceae bacterium]